MPALHTKSRDGLVDAVLPRRRGRTESDERGVRNDTEAPSSSAYFVSRAGRLVTGVSRSLGLSSHRRLLPRSVLAHSVLPPPCRIYKLVKKSAKEKKVKRGVKECIKAIRKNQKGIMVIAGNISPIDVVTPLPVLCEDNDIPYVFVSSKEALGQAGSTKRPTSCMLVMKGGGTTIMTTCSRRSRACRWRTEGEKVSGRRSQGGGRG